ENLSGGDRRLGVDYLTVLYVYERDVEVLLTTQHDVLLNDDVEVFVHLDDTLQLLEVALHLKNQGGSSELGALKLTDFLPVTEEELSHRSQRDLLIGLLVLELGLARLDEVCVHRTYEYLEGAIFFLEEIGDLTVLAVVAFD